MSVQQAFILHTCSLGPPVCPFLSHKPLHTTATAPHTARFWGTGSPLNSKPLMVLHFFFFFPPFGSRRFVWKCNDNKSSRFERFSQEKEKDSCTQTSSRELCQQQLGKWQAQKWVTTPQRGREPEAAAISLDLLLTSQARFHWCKGPSWLASDS